MVSRRQEDVKKLNHSQKLKVKKTTKKQKEGRNQVPLNMRLHLVIMCLIDRCGHMVEVFGLKYIY